MPVLRDVDLTVTNLGGGNHRIAWDLKHHVTTESISTGSNDFVSTSSASDAMKTTMAEIDTASDDDELVSNLFDTFEVPVPALQLARGVSPYNDHFARVTVSDIGGGEHRLAWVIWEIAAAGTTTQVTTGQQDFASTSRSRVARLAVKDAVEAAMKSGKNVTDLGASFTITFSPVEGTTGLTFDQPYTVEVTHTDNGANEDFAWNVKNGSASSLDTGTLSYPDATLADVAIVALKNKGRQVLSDSFTVADMSASFTLGLGIADFNTSILNAPYTIDVTRTFLDPEHRIAWSVKNGSAAEIGTGSTDYPAATLAKTVYHDVRESARVDVAAESAVSSLSTGSFNVYTNEIPIYMGPAELPRERVDTSVPTTSTTKTVKNSGGDYSNLQTAIDTESLDTTLLVDADVVWNSAELTMPKKTGTGWMVIQSAGAIPAAGTRVGTGDAAAMPKIEPVNSSNSAVDFADGAHHYRFVGIEFRNNLGAHSQQPLVNLPGPGTAVLADMQHHVVFDRCIVDGSEFGQRRGMSFQGAHLAAVECYIYRCMEVGADSQCIAGWDGPGPFKIVNNYLEGAAENILFGGAGNFSVDHNPADIEIQKNNFFKPQTWDPDHVSYAGTNWSVKNLFELKNATRTLVKANTFEQCWVGGGQAGYAIVLTVRNQVGKSPWATVRDVAFVHNIIDGANGGVNILADDNNFKSQRNKNIYIWNNIMEDLNGSEWGAGGRLFQLLQGTINLVIDNNTIFHSGTTVVLAEGFPHANSIMRSNLVHHNSLGVVGTGTGTGTPTFTAYFPGIKFLNNHLTGGSAFSALYDASTVFPTDDTDVDFVNQGAKDYNLAGTSAYLNGGHDGDDPGVNWTLHDAAGPPTRIN